jgi:hypothetical protein
MAIDWKLFYADYTTYSNENGTWENAPKHGVICVVVRDPTGTWGRWVYSGHSARQKCAYCKSMAWGEFYIKRPGSKEPYNTYELGPFLAAVDKTEDEADSANLIKYGQQVDQADYVAIMDAARNDPDFPISSPKRRAEDWKG